jgi:AraC-like DNA-binding protein
VIGKTRQTYDEAAGPARGILQPKSLQQGNFAHSRRVAADGLAAWVAHYWTVAWDLAPGVRQVVETLPHPTVHLVFTSGDPATAEVHGIHTGKFTRVLEGRQNVFGVKFRPGAFRPFLGRAVSTLQNVTVTANSVFASAVDDLTPVLTSEHVVEREKIALANRFLLERAPPEDPKARLAITLAERIAQNPALSTVEQVAKHGAMSERSLQRLFHEYVGIGPKWVILRYRLHELVERLNSDKTIDWAAEAAALGYFDQSHLIRDFRSLTGSSPESYRKQRAATNKSKAV